MAMRLVLAVLLASVVACQATFWSYFGASSQQLVVAAHNSSACDALAFAPLLISAGTCNEAVAAPAPASVLGSVTCEQGANGMSCSFGCNPSSCAQGCTLLSFPTTAVRRFCWPPPRRSASPDASCAPDVRGVWQCLPARSAGLVYEPDDDLLVHRQPVHQLCLRQHPGRHHQRHLHSHRHL